MKTQAFPGYTKDGYNEGMSLVDYFAGQVVGHLAVFYDQNKQRLVPAEGVENLAQYIARNSYDVAEAMVEERLKHLPPLTLSEKRHVSQSTFDFINSTCACYSDGNKEYFYVGNRWFLLEVNPPGELQHPDKQNNQ